MTTALARGPRLPRSQLCCVGLLATLLLVGCDSPDPPPPTEAVADTPAAFVPDTAPHLTISAGLPATLSEYHLRRFRERGLQDPRREIPTDLARRPDLIPEEGVLGGTMRFTEVTLLTDRWVLATFEDGHIQGHAIFEYSVEEGGRIRWRVVDHYVD